MRLGVTLADLVLVPVADAAAVLLPVRDGVGLRVVAGVPVDAADDVRVPLTVFVAVMETILDCVKLAVPVCDGVLKGVGGWGRRVSAYYSLDEGGAEHRFPPIKPTLSAS